MHSQAHGFVGILKDLGRGGTAGDVHVAKHLAGSCACFCQASCQRRSHPDADLGTSDATGRQSQPSEPFLPLSPAQQGRVEDECDCHSEAIGEGRHGH